MTEVKYDTRNKIATEWSESDLSLSEEQVKQMTEKSSYSLDQLIGYQYTILQTVTDKQWTLDKPLTILRKFKLRVTHIQLTGVENTKESLNHLYQTICLAIHLKNSGYVVHIIEGVTADDLKIHRDVDLIVSLNGVLTLIDYTQKNSSSFGQEYRSDEMSKMKLLKLKHIFPNLECHRKVMSNPRTPLFDDLQLVVPEQPCPTFSDDFNVINKLIPLVHTLDNDNIDQLIQAWVLKFKPYIRDSMIKYPGRVSHFFQENVQALVTCAQTNSEEQAKLYEHFLHEVRVSGAGGYSCDWLDTMMNHEEKPLYDIPLAVRVPGIPLDPFERCREISNTTFNSLAYLISLCIDDKIHPTPEEEEKFPNSSVRAFYRGVKVRRVFSKGRKVIVQDGKRTTGPCEPEKVNVIKMMFTGPVKSLSELVELTNIKPAHGVNGGPGLEAEYKKAEDQVSKTGQGSLYSETVLKLIDCCLETGSYSDSIRSIMKQSCSDWLKTQQASHLAFIQEVATSLGVVPKKTKLITMSSKSGFKHESCFLSVDNVTDRMAVSVVNMNAKMGQHVNQTCTVLAQFIDTPFCRPHSSGQSNWYTMTPAKLDWECRLFHCTLSYITLLSEMVFSNRSKVNDGLNILRSHHILGGLLMSINSDKFAVASDMVRYLYVNATGISVLPDELYKKISGYKPATVIEKLFMFRMHKMASLINLFKSNRQLKNLIKRGKQHITGPSGDTDERSYKVITVCFPHENLPVVDDMHAIDSLYICRNFSIQRYKKTLSEAQVIEKQLDARERFLKTRSLNNPWEARNLTIKTSDDLLYEIMTIDIDQNFGLNSPTPLAIIMGFLVTVRSYEGNTVDEKLKKPFNFEKKFLRMTLSETMNNRGSVMRGNTSCLLNYNESTECKDGKVKKIKSHQNSRAHQNLCLAYSDVIKDIPYPPMQPVAFVEYERPTMSQSDWFELAGYPDLLWPTLLHCLLHLAKHVSKMVHKDQVGVREIAVLNAPARVACYFVEETARHIRDVENSKGDMTNLIEVPDKNDVVKRAYNKSRFSAESGLVTMYDSADCSKWGPTMLSPILYMVLALRVRDPNYRSYLCQSLRAFGDKVFKIPDNFYNITKDLGEGNNLILRTKARLMKMAGNLGDFDRQIIFLPESMHQGILGVSSSCLAADCMRLACKINKECFNLKECYGFVTSDDYERNMEADIKAEDSDLPSEAQLIKRTVSVHVKIQEMVGTERNPSKSTHSTERAEFNSEFMTPSGTLKADVKSRVSFVDYGQSTDPYQNALRCMTQGSEYLRVEGSLVGALWVQLLNTSLSMIQNQSIKLFKDIGSDIFRVPLEYGGYPKLNPVLSNHGSDINGILFNYDPTNKGNARLAYSIIMEMMPKFGDMSLTEDEKDMKSRVPRTSRSSVVHLCRRDLRSNRSLRDLLAEIPRTAYTNLANGKASSSVLLALMGCLKREESDSGEESSHLRMSVPQTGYDSKLFRVTNTAWGLKELVSRSDLYNMAKCWLESEVTFKEDSFEFLGVEVKYCDYPLHFEYAEKYVSETLETIRESSIVVIQSAPRHTHLHTQEYKFSDGGFVQSLLMDFDDEWKPAELFGPSKVEPSLYLESRSLLQQRMDKLVLRKPKFRMMQYSNDKRVFNFAEQILVSCTIGGTRTLLSRVKGVTRTKPVDDNYRFLEAVMKHKTTGTSQIVDILSADFYKRMQNRQVGLIDISEMLNAHFKTSSHFSFNDVRSEQWIFASLARSSQKFCIIPGKIRPKRETEIFFGVNRDKVWCTSRLVSGEPKGLTCIVKENGKFLHYETILSKVDAANEEDSFTDTYKILNTSHMPHVMVELTEWKGLVVVKFGDLIITVLGPSFPQYVCEVDIKERFPDESFFEKLDVTSHQPLSVFQTTLPDFVEGTVRPLSDDSESVEEVDEEELNFRVAAPDDVWKVDENEFWAIMNEADEALAKQAQEEEIKELQTVVEDYDDLPPEPPDLGTEVTVSNLGVSVAPSSVFFLASNSLKQVKRGRSLIFTLKLPFLVQAPVEAEGRLTFATFNELLRTLEEDDQDSQWKVGFLREVIRLNPMFKDAL